MSTLTSDLVVADDIETAKTYKLSDTTIQGFVDETEALKQAIYKVLNTEKYEYPIYGFSYGVEAENLIGKDAAYVKIELKRRIRECLLRDDRISSVDNFTYTVTGEGLLCKFDVTSIYGNIIITKEVDT